MAVRDEGAHTGFNTRPEVIQAQERGRLRADIEWRIALKRGQVLQMPKSPAKALTQWCERRKAQVRAIVEHPSHIFKKLFGYRKVSYRGLAKNQAPALAQAALVNPYIARRGLMPQGVFAPAS